MKKNSLLQNSYLDQQKASSCYRGLGPLSLQVKCKPDRHLIQVRIVTEVFLKGNNNIDRGVNFTMRKMYSNECICL